MPLKLMAVLAHPDDESLGVGGTLAKYASEGVETYLVTATRGEAGRYRGHRDNEHHPGPQKLGEIRASELSAAAAVLGIRQLSLLDYRDQELDRADPAGRSRRSSRSCAARARTSSSRSDPTARTVIPSTSPSASSRPPRSSRPPIRRSPATATRPHHRMS
jgi:LmbE family N-acetylglucosaminyl deacetylase